MVTSARPRRHVVGPLLLLGAGLLLLLNNLGLAPWAIWRALWPFWPVLFIVLGVEALVTGRVAWGAVLATVVVVAIGSAVLAMSAPFSGLERTAIDTPAGQFRQDLGGASRAQVRVGYGGGVLRVNPLDDPNVLAEGSLYGQDSAVLDTGYRVRDGVGELTVQPRGGWALPWLDWAGSGGDGGRLDLRLSRNVPVELRLEVGAAGARIDLRDLQVPDLRIEAGASRATILLPTRGETRAVIEGGAASLTIEIPPEVAARIAVDSGLSDIQIDSRRFPRQGREYRSPDYDGATNRVDLSISVGAAHVDVQ